MNTRPISHDVLSVEDRIARADQSARRRLRWSRVTLVAFMTVGVILTFILLSAKQLSLLNFLGIGGIAAGATIVFKLTFDYQKSLYTPSNAQIAAIEGALNRCDYARAVQLADDLLLRVVGAAPLVVAAAAYLRAGKVAEAHFVSEKAAQIVSVRQQNNARIEPQHELARARTWLGATLLAEQRYIEAERVLAEAMQANPQDKFALVNYVEALLFQKKEVSRALDLIQKVVDLDKQTQHPPTIYAHGPVQFRQIASRLTNQ